MTEQGTSLEIILVSMQAYVERCAAEIHDPETTTERVQEIVSRLRPIYEALKQLNADIRAHERELIDIRAHERELIDTDPERFELSPCNRCGGNGMEPGSYRIGPDGIANARPCAKCHGGGRAVSRPVILDTAAPGWPDVDTVGPTGLGGTWTTAPGANGPNYLEASPRAVSEADE